MSFIWTNQNSERENREKITNVQIKTFSLPPKRYIMHMTKDRNEAEIATMQMIRINSVLHNVHTL
jgi:hypothetical protein